MFSLISEKNKGVRMKKNSKERLIKVAENFDYMGELLEAVPYGNGHINDTFLLTYQIGNMGRLKVILQCMNVSVFPRPVEVMENVMHITDFLRRKVEAAGGDYLRETLNVIPTKDGKPCYKESDEDYWRSYVFVTDVSSYDMAESAEDFYQSALAFGNFQSMLSDYPADTLYETIEKFHDTRNRLAIFKKAVEEDICNRAADVRDEIQFVLDRESEAGFFVEMLERGELPLRVTHNDTKLNNVLIDNVTRKAICVVDLDTVMPGLAMYDFGDSIRFGASTAGEDERDLSKVSCSMELFEAYTKGFLEGCQGKLTKKEIELLPMGAKIMTFECGMRFLTDYLQGDTYFKIHREGHNLDRCRTQFKLVADMEAKWDTMKAIVAKYS